MTELERRRKQLGTCEGKPGYEETIAKLKQRIAELEKAGDN